jgi:hypothetical protein
MKKFKLVCVFLVLVNFICILLFAIKPKANVQLLGGLICLILLFLLLISFVVGICFFRRDKFHAFIPTLICSVGLPASIFIGSYLGVSIRDWQFRKNLPRYTEVVNLIEKGEIKATSSDPRIQLPNQYADLSWVTFAKTNNGSWIVEFNIGGGFPVKHSGYLYVSTGKIDDPETLERWPYRSQVNSNWFRVSD